MMLLILEIGLVIAAWKRGWKGWALMPIVIGFCAGFITGLVVGDTGGSEEDFFPIGIIFDVLVIGALVTMISKPRRVPETR
jgi:hydrogenase/urease accessory protein HupE